MDLAMDDGIYINIGVPDCCASHVRIDSVGCKEIVSNGTKINGSGIYLDTFEILSRLWLGGGTKLYTRSKF